MVQVEPFLDNTTSGMYDRGTSSIFDCLWRTWSLCNTTSSELVANVDVHSDDARDRK